MVKLSFTSGIPLATAVMTTVSLAAVRLPYVTLPVSASMDMAVVVFPSSFATDQCTLSTPSIVTVMVGAASAATQ